MLVPCSLGPSLKETPPDGRHPTSSPVVALECPASPARELDGCLRAERTPHPQPWSPRRACLGPPLTSFGLLPGVHSVLVVSGWSSCSSLTKPLPREPDGGGAQCTALEPDSGV